MLGFRGASRYISEDFRDCFALECEAIKRVRNKMGLTNVEIMIPFVFGLEDISAYDAHHLFTRPDRKYPWHLVGLCILCATPLLQIHEPGGSCGGEIIL